MTNETETDTLTFTQLVERDKPEVSAVARPQFQTKDDDGWEHFPWVLRLKLPGNGTPSIDTEFKTGIAHQNKGQVPTMPSAADVLYSLVSDVSFVLDTRTFEEWASDLGYETDSRKALAIYEACLAEVDKLRTLLGDKFTEYMNAETDY